MAIKTKGNMKAKAPPFAALPKVIVQSARYRSLSFVARAVLVEMLAQYNGSNNGDLSATRTMAKEWGVSSPNMLQKALQELDVGQWIIMTRSSVFSKRGARCALYAISWRPIDECPGKELEVSATRTPPRIIPDLIKPI